MWERDIGQRPLTSGFSSRRRKFSPSKGNHDSARLQSEWSTWIPACSNGPQAYHSTSVKTISVRTIMLGTSTLESSGSSCWWPLPLTAYEAWIFVPWLVCELWCTSTPGCLSSSTVCCFIWDVYLCRFFPPYFLHTSRFFVELRTKEKFPRSIWWPISPFMAFCMFLRLLYRHLFASGWHFASFMFFSDLDFFCHFLMCYLNM